MTLDRWLHTSLRAHGPAACWPRTPTVDLKVDGYARSDVPAAVTPSPVTADGLARNPCLPTSRPTVDLKVDGYARSDDLAVAKAWDDDGRQGAGGRRYQP